MAKNIAPRKLEHRRIRLGAIVFLSALGLTLFGIARSGLMAAPLAKAPAWGKVLIAGGSGVSSGVSSPLSSTELYDLSTNSFAPAISTATMNTGRLVATATLLRSGKVFIAGGFGECGTVGPCSVLSSTELYDPATNSFAGAAETASMNVARYGATATLLLSGKVLLAGGIGPCESGGPCSELSSTELYDPATNSFASAADTASMNVGRIGALATRLDSGKVLIAGGCCNSVNPRSLVSTELYDPATNSFAAAADTAVMNIGRDGATATLLNSGKVLIAGGMGVCGQILPCSELSSTELYDPASNNFVVAADTASMNVGRDGATATLLDSGKVLIAGGEGTGFDLSSTELYEPSTNNFESPAHATMNFVRYAATATLLPSGKVLIAGGVSDYVVQFSTTELYDPVANSFAAEVDTATMNVGRYDAVAVLLPSLSGQATLLPSTLHFGTISVSHSSDAQIVSLINGGGRFTIRGWSIDKDFKVVSSTCPSPTGVLRRGQSCDFLITFKPQSTGIKNELFRAFDSAENSPQMVKLHGVATRR